jgi:endonuclease III
MKRRETIISTITRGKSAPPIKQKNNPFESLLTKLSNQGIDFSANGLIENLVYQPPSDTFEQKMICQAIYYVANNEPRKARDCLKSIGMSSFNAKGWIKEEQAVQKRNPSEKEKYFQKLMPNEFTLNSLN